MAGHSDNWVKRVFRGADWIHTLCIQNIPEMLHGVELFPSGEKLWVRA